MEAVDEMSRRSATGVDQLIVNDHNLKPKQEFQLCHAMTEEMRSTDMIKFVCRRTTHAWMAAASMHVGSTFNSLLRSFGSACD